MMAGAIGAMLLCGGCGEGSSYDDQGTMSNGIIGLSASNIHYSKEDCRYSDCYKKSRGGDLWDLGIDRCEWPSDWACSKRTAAIHMSRHIYTYSFQNYVLMDGVSGFMYNVGYLCSVPHKLLRGLRCMNGIWGYSVAAVKLMFGAVCSVVGMVASPIINTVCHPWETLANLTVGVAFVDGVEFLGVHPDSDRGWFWYVFRTNLVYTLWDLVWNSILYPLIQCFTFWM